MKLKELKEVADAVEEAAQWCSIENVQLTDPKEKYQVTTTVFLKSGTVHEGVGSPTLSEKEKLFCIDGFYAPMDHIEALRVAVQKFHKPDPW